MPRNISRVDSTKTKMEKSKERALMSTRLRLLVTLLVIPLRTHPDLLSTF
jgi:hypothetical protein